MSTLNVALFSLTWWRMILGRLVGAYLCAGTGARECLRMVKIIAI